MPNDTLERKIHFFEVDIGHDDGGAPHPISLAQLLESIEALPFTRDQAPSRYERDLDDSLLCVLPTPPLSRDAIRFCRVRFNGLPQLERSGNISDLDIDDDVGIVETTHAVFLPNNKVGIEYNHYGPRPSQLASYLAAKSGDTELKVELRPILKRDALNELNQLIDLRWFELRIHRAYADIVRQADPAWNGVVSAIDEALERPTVIPVDLKFENGTGRRNLRRYGGPLSNIAGRTDLRENTTWFRVHGKRDDTNRVETIDLLGDRLVSRKRIVRVGGRGRALSSTSAFQAIREAYDDLSDEIEFASSVSIST